MSTGVGIPQRIIQTARSRDLPPLARAAAANLRLLHPGWEFLFFDDTDVDRFVANEYPHYRKVYESFPRRIQRFDFFRYLAVLRHGGFYFDLDVFLSESVSPLCFHRCVFPFEELTLNRYLANELAIDWEIGNYAFGAAAQHPFLELVVENCVRAQRDPAWLAPMMRAIPAPFRRDFYVLNTTGPGMLTRSLVEARQLASDVTVLFPSDVCDPTGWHQFGRFGVHLMEASWRDRGSFLMRKLKLYWETSTRRRTREASLKLGRTRTGLQPGIA